MPSRMFLVALALLHLSSDALTNGVLAPPGFVASTCTDTLQWSIWFDSGDPDSKLGEFEVTNHIQQTYPRFMCPTPVAIEVRLINAYTVPSKDHSSMS